MSLSTADQDPQEEKLAGAGGAAEQFWRNPAHGAKKRVAHYLHSVVGEGNSFDVDSLRDAIRKPDGSGVDEVDRRMRELREVGWRIRNYKDMTALAPNQLHLEKVGDHIWEPGYRTARRTTLSARDRRAVYERDGHRCAVCAIDFGTEYPHLLEAGQHVKARPTIGHWVPRERGGTDDLSNLRPECHLCNEQSRNLTGTPVDPKLVRRKILELKKDDKRRLASWLDMGRRTFSDLDIVWAELNQLPSSEKDLIHEQLAKMLGA
jgi:5-methylcytosine-specific restriction endonuclease McrA